MHSFILIQLDNFSDDKVKVNLPDDLKDKVQIEDETPVHEILCQLLKVVAGVKQITVPADFKSGVDESEAINCSVKVSDGYLYPLKQSLIFI